MIEEGIQKIRRLASNPWYIFCLMNGRGWLNWLDDKTCLKLIYRGRMRKKLNLRNPQTFNEKLQWIKLYDRNPQYTELVDKYRVREYIEKTIGKQYLIPLIGVYDKFEDIDFATLPERFVLKCTHDSGGLVICPDKNKLDIELVKQKINKCLKKNYYYHGREWPYKNVRPRIVCEQYMENEPGEELLDYKFLCFNSNIKGFYICLNRYSGNGLSVDFYDINWNPMPFEGHYKNYQYKKSGKVISKPKTFETMIELAEKLSVNIPFVRVDFYDVKGQVYFGEMTLLPGSGCEEFTPETFDYLLGSWIELPPTQNSNC